MSNLEHALEVAAAAHEGQSDKSGRPYVEHCRRVSEMVGALDEKIVAWLHDVVEKGAGWPLARLQAAGFSPAVVAAVDALTRRCGEEEAAYVRRAAANPLARPVKKADLEDNLQQAHLIGAPTERYREGLRILEQEFGVR
jgi:(p)ppGpp synthase/HD superfamily hydrolase